MQQSLMKIPSKYRNLALLVLGIVLGQGSLFLANTHLYWAGQYRLVAEFGAANALVTLIYLFGDWGGLTYLAKEVVTRGLKAGAIGEDYLTLSLFRLVIALAINVGLFIYCH